MDGLTHRLRRACGLVGKSFSHSDPPSDSSDAYSRREIRRRNFPPPVRRLGLCLAGRSSLVNGDVLPTHLVVVERRASASPSYGSTTAREVISAGFSPLGGKLPAPQRSALVVEKKLKYKKGFQKLLWHGRSAGQIHIRHNRDHVEACHFKSLIGPGDVSLACFVPSTTFTFKSDRATKFRI